MTTRDLMTDIIKALSTTGSILQMMGIDERVIDDALKDRDPKQPVGECLMEKGVITPRVLAYVLDQQQVMRTATNVEQIEEFTNNVKRDAQAIREQLEWLIPKTDVTDEGTTQS